MMFDNTTGLSLETISGLIGNRKPIILDPEKLSVKVTFRPLPHDYSNANVKCFLSKLNESLRVNGIEIVPWENATSGYPDNERFYVKEGIQGVFDVDAGRPVKDMMSLRLQDRLNTLVITVTDLDEVYTNPDSSYDMKIGAGLRELARTFSPIVLGVSEDRISVTNMNLDDAVISINELDDYIRSGLIPKIATPIYPIPLSAFKTGYFNPDDDPCVAKLITLASNLGPTQLFPHGTKFLELLKSAYKFQSEKEMMFVKLMIDFVTEGRTGVSYGFNAIMSEPVYNGPLILPENEWKRLVEVENFDSDELRQDDQGTWYLKTKSLGQHIIHQVPDIWVYSSRSGVPDKTNLTADRDIVRIGLVKGQMMFQIPEGLDIDSDIKPSYDTSVMLAIALAAALYTPKMSAGPIIHFHGYIHPDWFKENEFFTGQHNPHFPCGTVEAAVLSFIQISKYSNNENIRIIAINEPGHGSILITDNSNYLLRRLNEGCGLNGSPRLIENGGKHLAELKERLQNAP